MPLKSCEAKTKKGKQACVSRDMHELSKSGKRTNKQNVAIALKHVYGPKNPLDKYRNKK